MENLLEQAPLLLVVLFLMLTFLQSGVDKVIDWKGNLDFISGHFKKSPLGGMVPLLLAIITVMELAAGILLTIGLVQIIMGAESLMAYLGLILSGLSLVFLLFGQRLAKDYDGAKTLAIYFIVVIAGFLLY
ncbi:MAG: hypothetical protein ACPG4Y_03185 [Chitinophagales bacterium]